MTSSRSILIVDDSATYRHQLRQAIDSLPGMNVVGEASTGKAALQFMSFNKVDCLTLDIEMPEMTGIEVVKEIRKTNKTIKIIMFSSLSQKGAVATLSALSAGADDFVAKPTTADHVAGVLPWQLIKNLIGPKLDQVFGVVSDVQPISSTQFNSKKFDWGFFKPKIIVIGSSTGGPAALEKLFTAVRWPLRCPVVIAQHMPAVFTQSLAERLSLISKVTVREAVDAQRLMQSDVLIAPGNFHLKLQGDSTSNVFISLDQSPQRNFVRPAVDHLFETAANIYGSNCLGIVLTGMGYDGKDGAKAIKEKNGAMAIQDKESSIVYGMPGAVKDDGNHDYVGDPSQLADLMNKVAGT